MPWWFWVCVGVAGYASLIWLLLFAGRRSEDASHPYPAPIADLTHEREKRVHRSHLNQTTAWRRYL